MKHSFKDDYSELAAPRVLKALSKVSGQHTGYGEDGHTIMAQSMIRREINYPADVHFIAGGTLTNIIALSHMLKPYEAVIAPRTAHVSVHETGAIEATGHKVIEAPSEDGKLTVDSLAKIVEEHNNEHMVKPRVACISNSTEVGSIYTKEELSNLSNLCKEAGLYLYMDGARLGTALTAKDNDLKMEDLPKLVDMFYIGGTKNGALFGEALVTVNEELKKNIRYSIKQKGGLMAKGAAIGAQFEELFKNGLFYHLGEVANSQAENLAIQIERAGLGFQSKPVTNQLFPVLPNSDIEKLEEHFGFHRWAKIDEHYTAIRLVTSWATDIQSVLDFGEMLSQIRDF